MGTGDLSLWRAADEIFDRLLDLGGEEREAALADMALEPALEAHVRRLMAAHDRADGPLDPAGPDAELEGRRIGCWMLEEEIGRGGMSVVFRARTDEGGETRVAAIKLLTLGALVAGGVQRFKREQSILARLQHPHIAGLIDCGVTPDGTPWLAMPLVDGQPIDVWCDERNLGVGARVQLMLDVCDAVAYAHRNLVIHRDIKPSNVLVDREGYVRLLDFGIGGLLESRQAGMTLTRMLAWTPQYAAPEQFKLAPASTAMDVYGLGALLYRLLTGRPPREGQPDGEPVTLPSRACLEGEDGAGPFRRAAARALRGDLDAIVLKALAPDPDDRYRSPDALARDLGHWLHDRPVRARGSGALYRVQCFLRRNRAGVAVSVLLGVLVAALAGAAIWQGRNAEREVLRLAASQQLLADLLVPPAGQPGPALATPQALEAAARRVRDEVAEPARRATLLHQVGALQWRLGDAEGARSQLIEAQALAHMAGLPPEARRESLLLLAEASLALGDGAAADDWLHRALDTGRLGQADAAALWSRRCIAQARAGRDPGDCDAEVQRRLTPREDPAAAAEALRTLALAQLLAGAPEIARQRAEAAGALDREAGQPPGSPARLHGTALVLLAQALHGKAEPAAASALESGIDGLPPGQARDLAILAVAAHRRLAGQAGGEPAIAPAEPLASLQARLEATHTPP